MKKIFSIILAITMLTAVFAPTSFARLETVAEWHYRETFSDYTNDTDNIAPDGWSRYVASYALAGNYVSILPKTFGDGHGTAVQLTANAIYDGGRYGAQLVQLFDKPYTDGYMRVSYELYMEPTTHISMYSGLIESYDSLVNAGKTSTDYISTKALELGAYQDTASISIFPYMGYDKLFMIKSQTVDGVSAMYPSYAYSENNSKDRNSLRYPYNNDTVTVKYADEAVVPDWYAIDSYIDINTKSVTTYVNGELWYENLCVGNFREGFGYEGFVVTIEAPSAQTTTTRYPIYIDNVDIEHSENPISTVKTTVNDGEVVSTTAEHLTINFSTGITDVFDVEDITIKNAVTDEEYTDFEIESNGWKDVVLKLNTPLEGTSKYKISFSSIYTGSGGGTILPATFTTGSIIDQSYLLYEDYDEKDLSSADEAGIYVDEKGNFERVISSTTNSSNNTKALNINETEATRQYYLFENPVSTASSSAKLNIEFDMNAQGPGFSVSLLSQSMIDLTDSDGNAAPFYREGKIFAVRQSKTTNSSGVVTAQDETPHIYHFEKADRYGYALRKAKDAEGNVLPFTSFNEWVHVKMEIFVPAYGVDAPGVTSNMTITYTITDTEGNVSTITDTGASSGGLYSRHGAAYNGYGLNFKEIVGIGVMSGILYNGNMEVDTVMKPISIDNLKVYVPNETVEYPAVKRVTYESADGTISEEAPAGTKAISVNFSKKMKERTFKGTVTLKDALGQEIAYTGALSDDGTSYVITPSSALAQETAYTLNLANDITSKDGGLLYGGYTESFTTGKGRVTISELSITKDGTDVKLADVAVGDVITVTLKGTKTTTTAMDLWLLYGAYVSDRLDGAQALPIHKAADYSGSFEESFTVAVSNVTNLTDIKAFIWDYYTLEPIAANEEI